VTGIILAIAGLAMGGILKGATGAGAPIIAVPLMAMYYDVPLAITVFAIPNLATNAVQAWTYRKAQLPPRFMLLFVISGALGVIVGTLLLTNLSASSLTLMVGIAVFLYVGLRLSRRNWVLEYPLAEKLAGFVGLVGGTMFGATGLSAPVTLSFLNSMRLERRQFIGTVTVFFVMMGVAQVPMLVWYGIMTGHKFLLSCGAILPILAGMPVGGWLAKYMSRETFDKVILGLLTLIAIKLLYQSL